MHEILMLVVAGAVGLVLGAVFFGGLWWTVRQGVSSPRPALWFVGSLLLRTGIVLAGFYLVGGGQWQRLVVCLLGFVIARILVMRLTRVPFEDANSQVKEVVLASRGLQTQRHHRIHLGTDARAGRRRKTRHAQTHHGS